MRVRKLLCFGAETWRLLRHLSAGRRRGERRWGQPRLGARKERREGAGIRRRPGDSEIIRANADRSLFELPLPIPIWWEIDHWEDVWDEDLFWEDVTAEIRQRLKELLRS
jgi:hypothetical protein